MGLPEKIQTKAASPPHITGGDVPKGILKKAQQARQ